MGIYISDLEIPKDKAVQIVIIRDDGVCVDECGNTYGVVSLPPHGRLIDADEFVKRHKDWYCENCKRRKNSNGRFVYEIGGVPCRACDIGDMIDAVDDAPTVIEADYPPSTPLEQVWTELFGEDGEA